jgi:HAD superfamily hydrolase (TIGR01509 family)
MISGVSGISGVRGLRGVRAVLLDMGGVLLDVANEVGLPEGKWDYRGREALLHKIRAVGGRSVLGDRGDRLGADDLERLLFTPWRRQYERRYEAQREARWEPHLRRLRAAAGIRTRNLTLLGAWFEPYSEAVRAIPGALEAVRELRAMELPLALVSNVALPGPLYVRLLKREGFLPHFERLFFSYDEGSRKPSPAMLRRALEALGVEPQQAVMVGDRRSSDIAAGRAAQTATVWLRSRDKTGPKPDLEIDQLSELPALLRGWR